MPRARTYPYGLDEPLLWFGARPWTIRDSLEGTAILGDMGSGKTSGSGRTLRRAMLKAGYGGLVLCKKTDECASWIQDARDIGRQDQLLIVNMNQPWRFNFLDYQFKRVGEGAGYVDNAVALFMNLIENRRAGNSQAMRQSDPFWQDGAKEFLKAIMEALILADEDVSMDNIRQAIRGLPYADQSGNAVFPHNSFLEAAFRTARAKQSQGFRSHMVSNSISDVDLYFLQQFARAGANRQSAGILSTFTGMAQSFMGGPIQELLCSISNFSPAEFSRKGAVIIVDLPLDEWEEIGRTAALTIKYIWQKGVLRRQGLPKGEVPVFLWADEAANFITTADKDFQEASRSSMCATVFLTQNINNYLAAFSMNPEANTYGLLAGLGTKIFHRNGDFKTNTWAADTIARAIQIRYSGGESDTRSLSDSDSWGSNWGKLLLLRRFRLLGRRLFRR